MAKEKAIIIAANLKGFFGTDAIDVGNILAHASVIEGEGAVFWSIRRNNGYSQKPFPYPDIKRGYFYSVTDKAVTHVFNIDYIQSGELLTEGGAQRFMIPARKNRWAKNRRGYYYWVKISAIYRLKKEHPLRDFDTFRGKSPVGNCRNYTIVLDRHFACHNWKVTRREIMSDYIADLLVRGEVAENDIEELFSYRLAEKMQLKERQGFFQKAGRLDLLYMNQAKNYIVYELKKGIATVSALDQIKRYMDACIKKYKLGATNIKGVILARSIDPKLSVALQQEKKYKIETQTYSFSIDLK